MPFKIPFPNFISNVLHPTGSTLDLMAADDDLFSNFTVPDGVDRNLAIETIIEKYGMQALFRPDPNYMKHQIGVWSKRKSQTWAKLYSTLNIDYNPIDNTDKYEDYTDTRIIDRTTSGTTSGNTSSNTAGNDTRTETENGTTTRNDQTRHDVSAENADDYQADSRDTTDGTTVENHETASSGTSTMKTDGTSTETTAGSDKSTDTFTHTLHTHGNIGVTTTQQMIEAERECVRYNLYDEIAADYQMAFCLDIY